MSYFTQTGVLFRYGFSILFCITGILEAQTVQTYNYTGAVQTFTVPVCVNTLTMEVWGAQGGIDISSGGWDNNLGGYASAVFTVTPGQVMTIYVGGQPSSTVGGFNGGGSGYPSTMFAGMGRGGGGATDIRTGGTALTDRILVAGGGGGGGSDIYGNWVIGGGGGGLVGVQGFNYDGGCAGSQPGTQIGSGPGICAGVLNTNVSGGFGFGGDALAICGDGFGCGSASGSGEAGYGGGGGWYGGSGGSSNFGGSGGSGYVSPSGNNVSFGTAVKPNNGQARISYEIVMNLTVSSASCVPTGTASVLALNGIAPYTYTWSGSPQTTSLVTGLLPGIHTVTVSDAGSCRTRTASVLIASTLSLTAFSNCFPSNTATANASGGSTPYTYTWSGTAQTTSMVTGLSVGLHTLTASDLNGCQTKTASINIAASMSLTTLSSSCVATGSANVNANGGIAPYSYTWTGTAQTSSLVSGLAAGFYTVTVADVNSCQTKTAAVNVTTSSPIVVSNAALCIGYSTTMTAIAPTSSFTWSPGANLSSTSASLVSANPTITTIYTISTTNSLNCVSSTTAELYVVPTQTVPLVSPTTCVGQNLNLIANSTYTGALYSWSGPGGYTSSQQNPVIAISNFTNSGVYSLTVVSAPGCTSSAVTNASVFANPSPTITSNSPLCTNQTLTLSGTGATSYIWTGPSPNNFSSVSQNTTIVNTSTLDSGIYTLTGSFTTGCSTSVTRSITVRPLPATSFTYSNPVCQNGTLTLLGSGGSAYFWSGPNTFTSLAQNPAIPNIPLTASGIYSLLATLNTCTALSTQSITVNALPVPTATNNSAICETSSLQFGGAGGVNYNWAGPSAFTSSLQFPSIPSSSLVNSGVYTLTVTDLNGCVAGANTTVSLLANPTIAVTGAVVCLNEPGLLTVTGGTNVSWTGPSGFNSVLTNPTITTVNNITAGSYTAMITGSNSCTNQAIATLSFLTLPVLATSDATVCFNSAATLTVSGANSYTWTGPNTYLGTGTNAAIPLVNALTSGDYTVLGRGANSCTSNVVATLSTKQLPVVNATGTIVCLNQQASLSCTTSTDVASYYWTGPLNYTSTVQNPSILSATNNTPVNYTIIVSAQNNCTAQAVVTLSTHALPPVVSTQTLICKNQPFIIQASGASTYTWSGPLGNLSGPTVNISNVNAGSVGTYTVIGQDINTCTNIATASIDTLSLPHVTALGATVCIGQSAILNGFGAVNYFWQGPVGYTSTLANAHINNANSSITQIYTVTGTALNSCTHVAYANLDTYPLPLPTFTAPSRVCFGSNILLQGGGAQTYTWTGPYNYYSGNINVLIPVYNNLQQGNYTLSVTDVLGCKNDTTVYIKVDPLPVGTLVSDNSNNFCIPYCSEFRLKSSSVSPVVNTIWTFNKEIVSSESFSICIAKPTGNTVIGTFTDAVGCSNTISFALPANPKPQADYLFTPEKPVEGIDPVLFNDNSTGDKLTAWNWYFVTNKGYQSENRNTSYLFDNAGTYPIALVVSNTWGCADTIVKNIFVENDFTLFVPNMFTPNGDGMNDTFQPKGRGITKYNLAIYNRWGDQIFQTGDFGTGWNGQVNGSDSADGIYVWKINAVDTKGKIKDLTGHITLTR